MTLYDIIQIILSNVYIVILRIARFAEKIVATGFKILRWLFIARNSRSRKKATLEKLEGFANMKIHWQIKFFSQFRPMNVCHTKGSAEGPQK